MTSTRCRYERHEVALVARGAIGDLGGVDVRVAQRRRRRRAGGAGRRRRESSRCRRRGPEPSTSSRYAPSAPAAGAPDRSACPACGSRSGAARRRHRVDPISAIFWPRLTLLVVLDQQGLVVRVGGEVGRVVLQDDQVAVAAQARAGVDDPAVGRGVDRIAGLAAEDQALAARVVERRRHRRRRRPGPVDVVVAFARRRRRRRGGFAHGRRGRARARCRRSRRRRRSRCGAIALPGSRLERPRLDARRRHRPRRRRRRIDARRNDADHLADLDQVRIGQVVPAHQVFPVLAVVEADPDQRVARLDGVEAGLAAVGVDGHGLGRLGRGRRRSARGWPPRRSCAASASGPRPARGSASASSRRRVTQSEARRRPRLRSGTWGRFDLVSVAGALRTHGHWTERRSFIVSRARPGF